MASYNKSIILGNLGGDPVITRFDNGKALAKFSVATQEKFKNKDGETVTETTWHDVEVWGKLVDIIEKYLKKGREVLIEGPTKRSIWEDKEGVKHNRVFIDGKLMVMVGNKPQEHIEHEQAQPQGINEGLPGDDLPGEDNPW